MAYRYLIIGGGMTGDAAAKAIRERDPDGSIVLVGDEQHAPYARPPLSKALWKGKEEDSIWRSPGRLDDPLITEPNRLICARQVHNSLAVTLSMVWAGWWHNVRI